MAHGTGTRNASLYVSTSIAAAPELAPSGVIYRRSDGGILFRKHKHIRRSRPTGCRSLFSSAVVTLALLTGMGAVLAPEPAAAAGTPDPDCPGTSGSVYCASQTEVDIIADGDLIVWCDADITDFGPRFVTGLVGPLLTRPAVDFVQGFYDRPAGAAAHGRGRGAGRLISPGADPGGCRGDR